MPTLEIITIGTELLLGEITDTNSTYIARTMRDHGIDIYRITTIGDNPNRIANTIKEGLQRADIIITTGGLGPTIDDPTRQAVADAVGRQLVFLDELWEQIVERYQNFGRKPTENNRRQAFIPENAIPIRNPVGTAPCFIVEQDSRFIVSLPGVPQEMKHLLHHAVIPFLKQRFQLEAHIIKAAVLHVASMGESVIDEIIADLEGKSNPSVGLLAHPGQVDVRITAKASSEQEADQLMIPIIDDLYQRLGDNIYGRDGETLDSIVTALLQENNLQLRVIIAGFEEELRLFSPADEANIAFIESQLSAPIDMATLRKTVASEYMAFTESLVFGIAININDYLTLHLALQCTGETASVTRFYGGPIQHAQIWAKHVGLEFLRRYLRDITGGFERETK
ncbi:MAG TPA: molybdopterin-binding protein [Brevefilum sp.]|nr:molybdopterin-binding protein [Brevefilum sp.]HOR18900.1 molybdopterin-binding protein [Brevefilum sp.]HPL70019.1 molybdopterin-binding protein [Brevefilum sp.]